MNESAFFQDLAILMASAGLVAVVFTRFGWPKVIGYLLAGILMGAHTWGGSFLVDSNSISTIAQLGIVFLMFAMGLSFSTRDMSKLKGVIVPCAILDTIGMIWIGYTIGVRVFGWSTVQSVFLGVAICDSATTLLAKVMDELGWRERPFAKYVFGTSVCEDIVCVGAIAVATGFASGEGLSIKALSISLGNLAVFFLAVLVFGLVFIPRLLKSVARRRDDEALVLLLLGCCFFVSYFAYRLNLSLALGAFLVGIIGASSEVKDRLSMLVEPLKSMFAAMFFVSIGLLVDPMACIKYLPQILLIATVVVVGKFFNNTLMSLLTGLDLKTAIQNGFSLAQIGEFAFMVAILYAGLKSDMNNPMFQIAIGVSLLTTIINPWMIKVSDRVGDFAERNIPERFRYALAVYHEWLEKLSSTRGNPDFAMLRISVIKLGVYAVLIFAVGTVCTAVCRYDFSRFSKFFETYDQLIFFFLMNLFAVAMLPMILKHSRTIGAKLCILFLGTNEAKWLQPVKNLVHLVALIVVLSLFYIEWGMINAALAPKGTWAFLASIAVIVITGIVGWKRFEHDGIRAVERLNEALEAEDRREELRSMMTVQIPVDGVHRLVVKTSSPAVGGTVVTLNIRAKTGASVVAVVRSGITYRNVGPSFEFAPNDELVVLGEYPQIAALKDLLGIV